MQPSKEGNVGFEWRPCKEEDLKNVVVAPNWFEMLLKDIEMFHGNRPVRSSDEGQGNFGYVNAWKYNYMTKLQKKLLCPQECGPIYGIPTKKNQWTTTDGSEWVKNYGPKIFCDGAIEFDYVPVDVPPFFQGCNYLERTAKICPMPILTSILFRFLFQEDPGCIFRKMANTDRLYRFMFDKIYLVAEHLRLEPTFQKSLLTKKTEFQYPGVSRNVKFLNIPSTSGKFSATFQSVKMPEGLFIFAVPKDGQFGKFEYNDATNDNIFQPHNIDHVNISFARKKMFINDPHIGMINIDVIDSKRFFDYIFAPPFGLAMDPDKITTEMVMDGSKNTVFPHVYINLCNFGDKSRLIPLGSDPSIMLEPHDLDIEIIFKPASPTDVDFAVYFFYTDTNMMLTTKGMAPFFLRPTKRCKNVILNKINAEILKKYVFLCNFVDFPAKIVVNMTKCSSFFPKIVKVL
jgi:hypothetical protein